MSKIKSGVFGFIVGDAMGVPIEFVDREQLIKKPIKEMTGYGTYNMPEGTWSDDTSMTIATMESIVEQEKISYTDIMNRFVAWIIQGKYTPTGKVFDVGNTCRDAIESYILNPEYPLEAGKKDINSNGNGSLMRILPIVYYAYYNKIKDEELIKLITDVSSLTHGHEISCLGCYIYTRYLLFLLSGKDKFAAYNMTKLVDYSSFSEESLKVYHRLLKEDISKLPLDKIKSTGYVVDTLEASIWVNLNSKSFKQAIIGAINLGEDTDTVGAITGSIAGIIYGYSEIPEKWLNKLASFTELTKLTDSFEQKLSKIKEEKTFRK